jgi:hypothetical protein
LALLWAAAVNKIYCLGTEKLKYLQIYLDNAHICSQVPGFDPGQGTSTAWKLWIQRGSVGWDEKPWSSVPEYARASKRSDQVDRSSYVRDGGHLGMPIQRRYLISPQLRSDKVYWYMKRVQHWKSALLIGWFEIINQSTKLHLTRHLFLFFSKMELWELSTGIEAWLDWKLRTGLQIEGVLAYTHLKCQKHIEDDVGDVGYVFTKKSLCENDPPVPGMFYSPLILCKNMTPNALKCILLP